MGLLHSIFSKRKLNKNISVLAFWGEKVSLPKHIFIGPFAKIYSYTVGDYTRVRHLCTIAHANIGKFCSIAMGVKIGIGAHPTNLVSTNSVFYLSNSLNTKLKNDIHFESYQDINIGNDVWIGEKALIMNGINIGHGAIIAAHAVVTKDIPPYAIVGGVPAKVIKYRYSEDIIKALLELKWWDWTEKQLEQNKEFFAISALKIEDIEKVKNKILKQ